MIPIRNTISSKNFPIVNFTLIGINILVYLLEMTHNGNLDHFFYLYGLVPARYFVPSIARYFTFDQQLFSLISFMFLHGGFLHLLGNMWTLYIFGDNVEDHLGPFRYLLFYLLCGLASGFSQLIINPQSNVPTIGASGAIAGVMGAFFLLYPKAKILTLIPIIFIPWFIEIPAFFFLGAWFLLQFIRATGSHAAAGGVAWWAHIGGFISGIIFLKMFQTLPVAGVTSKIRQVTAKKKTHRLQVIRPSGTSQDSNLYATIKISPYEALVGTRKLVNIPRGFNKRLFNVLVPPGVTTGKVLKLNGLGRHIPHGSRGDLFLKVMIQ